MINPETEISRSEERRETSVDPRTKEMRHVLTRFTMRRDTDVTHLLFPTPVIHRYEFAFQLQR